MMTDMFVSLSYDCVVVNLGTVWERSGGLGHLCLSLHTMTPPVIPQ